MIISLYKDTFSKEYFNVVDSELMQEILVGRWRDDVLYLRSLSEVEYKKQKTKLAALTWSGTFTERLDVGLETYSQLVCLDIDDLDPSTIDIMKSNLSQDEYVKYAFTSPSGKGIKIIVQVNTGPEDHLSAFLHLQKTFEEKYLFKVDDSGKNISRLCYVSWDERAIIKESQIFQVDTRFGKVSSNYVIPENLKNYTTTNDNKRIFNLCVGWVNRTKSYVSGQRNVYVHALACALNRCGIEMSVAEGMLVSEFDDLDQKEVFMCCKSAYFRNAGEHGSVEVKDIGNIQDFVAPPYIANYTDDVVLNDIMRITAMLYHKTVDIKEIKFIVARVAKSYQQDGMIDINRSTLAELMNKAIQTLNSNIASVAEKNALNYQTAEEMGAELLSMGMDLSAPTTGIDEIDRVMGGMPSGNFYGIIGFGGTFKSILAMYMAYVNAMRGIPSLYFNGEMSKLQYYERLALIVMNIIWKEAVDKGEINHNNIADFISRMMEKVQRNMLVYTGSGFNEANVISTIHKIEATENKKIRVVFIDGITQMDSKGREEIPAAISNSGECKEIAKKTDTTVIGLLHVSGPVDKTYRDTGEKVRGGQKIIANMDGYFSTSLLIDREATEALENDTDTIFLPGKMYLRYTDKRSGLGVINSIVNIGSNLHLRQEVCDPNSYEVKINRR